MKLSFHRPRTTRLASPLSALFSIILPSNADFEQDLGRIFGSASPIRKLVSTKYHVLSLRHGGKRAGIDAEVTPKGEKGER